MVYTVESCTHKILVHQAPLLISRIDHLAKLSMNLDTWTALGSLGMIIMFVALLISFYIFLIGPQGDGPEVVVDVDALMYQVLSISGIPGLILAGVAYGMRKTDFSQATSSILIGTGLMLTTGMIFAHSIAGRISIDFQTGNILIVPLLFLLAGIGVIAIGVMLYLNNRRGKSRKLRNFNRSL